MSRLQGYKNKDMPRTFDHIMVKVKTGE